MRTYKLLWFEVWKGLPPKDRIFLAWNAKRDEFVTIHATTSFRVTLAIVLLLAYFWINTYEPTTP